MASPSKKIRAKLAKRDGGWFCCWCKQKVREDVPASCKSKATIEHVIPRSEGGVSAMSNYALACLGCNSSRAHAQRRAA